MHFKWTNIPQLHQEINALTYSNWCVYSVLTIKHMWRVLHNEPIVMTKPCKIIKQAY